MNIFSVGAAFLAVAVLSGCDGAGTSASPSEKTSAPDIKEMAFSFDGVHTESVKYEAKNGLALFEGDIVLPVSNDRKNASGVVRNPATLWDQNGTIVYDLQAMPTDLKESWFSAMRHIALRTNLRFTRDKELYKTVTGYGSAGPLYSYSYIRVVPNNAGFVGGYSQVGRMIGPQDLGLSSGVNAGLIAHELLHAVGHWHEQSRADRDQFVRVNTQNIQAGYEGQFSIHASDGQMVGGYDYCSVMHYFSTAFSANDQPTIVPLNTFSCQVNDTGDRLTTITTIGQRSGLSNGDIQTVAAKYPNVTPARPFAFAGFDQNLTVQTSSSSVMVTLDGSRSFPGAGTGLTYSWKPVGFVQCTNPYPPYIGCSQSNPIQNNTSAIATVAQTFDYSPAYPRRSSRQYELTVTDASGRQMRDIVTVNITGYY